MDTDTTNGAAAGDAAAAAPAKRRGGRRKGAGRKKAAKKSTNGRKAAGGRKKKAAGGLLAPAGSFLLAATRGLTAVGGFLGGFLTAGALAAPAATLGRCSRCCVAGCGAVRCIRVHSTSSSARTELS